MLKPSANRRVWINLPLVISKIENRIFHKKHLEFTYLAARAADIRTSVAVLAAELI